MKDLEDEAVLAEAELERGDGVLHVALCVGPPLDVQAHHELSSVAADVGGDPGVDEGGVGGEEGVDDVGVESDVV